MSWLQAGAIALAFLWGLGSALIPVLNAEAYVIAGQAAASPSTGVFIAVAVAAGQTLGKIVLFLGARRGKEAASRRRRKEPRPRREPRSRWGVWVASLRQRFAVMSTKLLELVGSPRWGIPTVALAASVGLPPMYAVALVAGASRMRTVTFVVVVWLGRTLRFVLIAKGVSIGLTHLF